MKPYFPVFKFVAVFGGLYLILSLAYYYYLQQEWSDYHYPDPVTAQVSYQTMELLQLIGYDASTFNTPGFPSVTLYIDQVRVYRVIDGCNAISVMILFVSFVLAFAKAWKKTALFIGIGLIFIYLVNLFRLVVLGIIYSDYVAYKDTAHELAFPAIIYGSVILLWIYWIKKPKIV